MAKLSFFTGDYSGGDFRRVDVYINGRIRKSSHYDYVRNMLYNLSEGSVVILHIDASLGDVRGAVSLIDAIRGTKAKVIANVTYAEGVAALIALACDDIRVVLGGTLVIRLLSEREDSILQLDEDVLDLEAWLISRILIEDEDIAEGEELRLDNREVKERFNI